MTAHHDDESISSRGEVQADVARAFLVLAWFFIALRVWTRTHVISNFGWDDSTMVLAGALFTVYCGAMLYLQANGGGTHITDVADLIHLTKWTIVGEATYIITVMVLKISLGIFFARIVVNPWQLWTIYVTVAINILSSTSAFFYALLRCGANLDVYVYRQLANQCTPRGLDRFFAYQQAAFTTLTDCVFATIPVFILWNVHMDTRSKISVGLILSLAALGSVCSMVRFKYVDGLTQIEDFYWNATNIAIWSTIEPGAGIIAGCLATLRPGLKRFLVKARSIRTSSSRSTREPPPSSAWTDTTSNRKRCVHVFSPGPALSRGNMDASVYAHHGQTVEYFPDASKRQSTEWNKAQLDNDEYTPAHQQTDAFDQADDSYPNYSRKVPQPKHHRIASNNASFYALPPLPDTAEQATESV